MKRTYKNPKELATKIKDLVDSYKDGLISEEKFETTIMAIIESNEGSVYKNGFMPTKLLNVIGEERKSVIDEVVNKFDK